MRLAYREKRLWWGIALGALLLAAAAASTWYWYASHPKPPPAGATLVDGAARPGGSFA